MHDVLPDEYKMSFTPERRGGWRSNFQRKTLLTPARPPLGVTVITTDGIVFTKVTMSARKYDSYEPPDPGTRQ
jgi:hypothetical protein